VRRVFRRYRAEGKAERPNPEIPSSSQLMSEAAEFDDSGGKAQILICEVNSQIIVLLSEASGLPEVILDDSIRTDLMFIRFAKVDGNWLLDDHREVDAFDGAASCTS
jgi:hypothetical protein